MMKLLFIVTFTAGVIAASAAAQPQERVGDGVVGAIAGGLVAGVAGPVGLVAGAAIGYTTGPHISRGLGFHHRRYVRHVPQHDER